MRHKNSASSHAKQIKHTNLLKEKQIRILIDFHEREKVVVCRKIFITMSTLSLYDNDKSFVRVTKKEKKRQKRRKK